MQSIIIIIIDQGSFITSLCDVKYLRLGRLVHLFGWGANGTKLPSVGLWLNAFKSRCRLHMTFSAA